MDLDKESLAVLNTVLNNPQSIPDEDLGGGGGTHGKKHTKPKKKDSSLNHGNDLTEILKSNSSLDEKLQLVCNKYSEIMHANRKLMVAYKMSEGRATKLQLENEQCQQQRSKAVLARSRLENLCRELQKLNKAQKEEIDLKLRLEEEKRKEISATFQSAFAEMSTLTNQNTEKNTKMREENMEMREKIKSVRERIELSEQQLEKVRQQAQLEIELAEAKMAASKMEMNALAKSNQVFSGFNEEMEKMSKKIVKLEKETSLWKQRWEKSHASLLEMATDKQNRDTEMSKLNHKLSLLQELCKAFQRERTELLAQLRAVNGPAASSVHNIKLDKVDIKQVEELSQDCQQLKDDLAHLQDNLSETIVETNEENIKSGTSNEDGGKKAVGDKNESDLESTNNVQVNSQSTENDVKDSKPEVEVKAIKEEGNKNNEAEQGKESSDGKGIKDGDFKEVEEIVVESQEKENKIESGVKENEIKESTELIPVTNEIENKSNNNNERLNSNESLPVSQSINTSNCHINVENLKIDNSSVNSCSIIKSTDSPTCTEPQEIKVSQTNDSTIQHEIKINDSDESKANTIEEKSNCCTLNKKKKGKVCLLF
ncbi:Similar to TXLNA: Alpha-taxilin (Homo sapiens) [Cotesia congregata]|uniref:Similar to TXLNA: Alpha-taxilin (Homo sapiens) n=1 Tax=Cotesia congregata TaxID=51543 RepID=A0A8J2HK37_COTCN|nr:Similar to TXLNA: Alpha-taxilin (Homo sapiens) [Cotesia congregata]